MKTALLLLISAVSYAQTLTSVVPWAFAGTTGAVVTFYVQNGAVANNSYQLDFATPSASFAQNQFSPGHCPLNVVYSPGASRVVVASDAGGPVANFTFATGAALESGYSGPSSVSNSQCTAWDMNNGSSLTVSGSDLSITVHIDFAASYSGIHRLFWTFNVNGSGGPPWAGPFTLPGTSTTVTYVIGGTFSTPTATGALQLSGPDQGLATLGNLKSKVGVYRNGNWYLDISGTAYYSSASTRAGYFASSGSATPVLGDWSGTGFTKVGTFSGGYWLLDTGGTINNGVDTYAQGYFGIQGDVPVVGDWTGNGVSKVGIWRNGLFVLDTSGSGNYNPSTVIQGDFGLPGDILVFGDWNGDHRTKVGVWRGGTWILDTSGTANYTPGYVIQGDFGIPGDIPVVGKWDTSGRTKVGVYRPSTATFYLDTSGTANYSAGTTLTIPWGQTGDVPIIGDWNASGTDKVGIWRQGLWVLNSSEVTAFNGGAIIQGWFGGGTDVPIVGKW